jgi:hypothetical protein
LPRLCDLYFTGAENLARAADRVILGLVHVLNDVEVRTEFAGEGLGRERRFRGRADCQSEIREGDRLGGMTLPRLDRWP